MEVVVSLPADDALIFNQDGGMAAPPALEALQQADVQPETVAQPETPADTPKAGWLAAAGPAPSAYSRRDRALLDLLPVGILIYRLDRLLYANHAFLARMGHDSLHALEAAGGLDALYVEPGVSQASSTSGTGTPVTISANQHAEHGAQAVSADARLHTITWDDESALALIFSRTLEEDTAVAAALSDPAPAAIAAAVPLLLPAGLWLRFSGFRHFPWRGLRLSGMRAMRGMFVFATTMAPASTRA